MAASSRGFVHFRDIIAHFCEVVKSTSTSMYFEQKVVRFALTQWLLLTGWCWWINRTSLTNLLLLRSGLSAGLISAMSIQLLLLYTDGLLTWQDALPLHLCSLFGVLSSVLLWRTPALWREAVCFLGAPAAFLTLFFPLPAFCSHPLLMKIVFSQLHVLIALMPLYLRRIKKPLPVDPRRTLIFGNGYLVLICLFNRCWSTNYLFLNAAPAGTPLMPLYREGPAFYLCSLEMLCMMIFSLLRPFYTQFRK